MKFGFPLIGVSPRFFGEVAQAAEANGFESVWVPEHLVFPETMPPEYPYTKTGFPEVATTTPLYDAWVVLAYIAHATTTIRLGTQVYILPLRHPIATARSVVTLDQVSNGRVTLGMGVGWLKSEFEAVGLPFENRGTRTDEIIPLLRRLWSEDVVDHNGDCFEFGPVQFEPKPRQSPTIPIEVGGSSEAALRRAGFLGDGWMEIGSNSMDELGSRLAIVLRHRADAGRQDQPFEVTISGGLAPDLKTVRACEELGATRVVVQPTLDPGRKLDDILDGIKRTADEIISQV